MGLLDSAGVLTAGAAWRLTRSPALGRVLVEAVEHGDEDTRTIAGMALTRGGAHGRRLVVDALEEGSESEELVTVLQSIGDAPAERELRRLAAQDRPVAPAARRAVTELEQMRRR
ncbi:MAG TPA: hypothetical protein VMM13_08295 [Euzebya sp.]|nr:hypothetical protein [Euzebya sp.]